MTRRFVTTPTTPGGPLAADFDIGACVSVRTVQKPARVSAAGVWDAVGGLDNVHGNAYGFSNQVNGIWWEYDVVLPANKPGYCWAVGTVYYKSNATGIMQYTIDGVAHATIDTYVAGVSRGVQTYTYVDGGGGAYYVTSKPKKIVVRITCVGKNASSTTYMIVPLSFCFVEVVQP